MLQRVIDEERLLFEEYCKKINKDEKFACGYLKWNENIDINNFHNSDVYIIDWDELLKESIDYTDYIIQYTSKINCDFKIWIASAMAKRTAMFVTSTGGNAINSYTSMLKDLV